MTGLFDAISPAVRQRIAMQKELERRKAIWAFPGTYYKGSADLLLQHGQPYEGRVLPEEFRHLVGAEGQCFRNALLAAQRDPRVKYCEGIYSTGVNHFMSHAWCVYRGELLEVTLPTWEIGKYKAAIDRNGRTLPYLPAERWGYWGVCIDVNLVVALPEDPPILDRTDADQSSFQAEYLDFSDDRTTWPILEKPYIASRSEP
jgi:hypothetical protein